MAAYLLSWDVTGGGAFDAGNYGSPGTGDEKKVLPYLTVILFNNFFVFFAGHIRKKF